MMDVSQVPTTGCLSAAVTEPLSSIPITRSNVSPTVTHAPFHFQTQNIRGLKYSAKKGVPAHTSAFRLARLPFFCTAPLNHPDPPNPVFFEIHNG